MTTNKQKKATRVRQKLINRQTPKERQIKELLARLDRFEDRELQQELEKDKLPRNAFTGEPIKTEETP